MNQTTRTASALALLALAAVGVLQGCAPAVIGGTAVGVSMVHDRRTAATVLEDEKIELALRADIFNDKSLGDHSSVGITSYNRVVLLTGQAQTAEVKGRIVKMASERGEVLRVVDEIAVGPNASLSEDSADVLITSRVKVALFAIDIPGFDPTRVKVVTEQGVVYLMGLVTAQEADAAVEQARYVEGVNRVVKIFEYVEAK